MSSHMWVGQMVNVGVLVQNPHIEQHQHRFIVPGTVRKVGNLDPQGEGGEVAVGVEIPAFHDAAFRTLTIFKVSDAIMPTSGWNEIPFEKNIGYQSWD